MAKEKSLPLLDTEGIALHSRVLHRYFAKRVPIIEVDDLVQEVLTNLHARRKSTDIENIQGYLFTVAANVLARRHRKTASQVSDVDIEQAEADSLSPERILIGQQRLAAALEVIRALPPRTRQVFILHRFEEMTYARIAVQLMISTSAVEKHIMLALKALHANVRGND